MRKFLIVSPWRTRIDVGLARADAELAAACADHGDPGPQPGLPVGVPTGGVPLSAYPSKADRSEA